MILNANYEMQYMLKVESVIVLVHRVLNHSGLPLLG